MISTSSILKSASGCGWVASRTCLIVTGLRVSLPYVPFVFPGQSKLDSKHLDVIQRTFPAVP